VIELFFQEVLGPLVVAILGLAVWYVQRRISSTPSAKERHESMVQNMAKINEHLEDTDEALVCIIRKQLNDIGAEARKNGCWKSDLDLRNYTQMYDLYKRRGGNGSVDALYKITIQLPVKGV